MREESAVYFPDIRVPNSSWFTHVLLYWESAALIHPAYFEPRGYTAALNEAGLLRIVTPQQALAGDAPHLREMFLTRLDVLDLVAPVTDRIEDMIKKVPRAIGYDPEAAELFDEMRRRRLAQPLGDGTEMWGMDYRAAFEYGVYLAACLCNTYDGLSRVTDREEALASLATPHPDVREALAALRLEVILNSLPMPSQSVSISELAHFKRERQSQLRELRVYLSGKLVDLALTSDPTARGVLMDALVDEVRRDIAEISAEMSKRNWPRVLLGGVAGLVAPALGLGAAVASGGDPLALGLGIAAGAVGLPPAAIAAAEVLQRNTAHERSPLAYAALVPRTL